MLLSQFIFLIFMGMILLTGWFGGVVIGKRVKSKDIKNDPAFDKAVRNLRYSLRVMGMIALLAMGLKGYGL